MKSFIIEWTVKARNGSWRDYRRYVETDNVAEAIKKMRFSLTGIPYGAYYKGAFRSATEVVHTEAFSYRFKNLIGGQYYFVKDGVLTQSTCTWSRWYDYKLKGWIR